MKRRVFLTTTSAIGIAGAASGASVVSSVYTSLSTNASLAEFSTETKKVLDRFATELSQNIQEHDLNEEQVAAVAIPVRIIKKEFKKGNHQIVYKNKAGNYITLRINKGVETILISNSL